MNSLAQVVAYIAKYDFIESYYHHYHPLGSNAGVRSKLTTNP
jgi:hypothetical protein